MVTAPSPKSTALFPPTTSCMAMFLRLPTIRPLCSASPPGSPALHVHYARPLYPSIVPNAARKWVMDSPATPLHACPIMQRVPHPRRRQPGAVLRSGASTATFHPIRRRALSWCMSDVRSCLPRATGATCACTFPLIFVACTCSAFPTLAQFVMH